MLAVITNFLFSPYGIILLVVIVAVIVYLVIRFRRKGGKSVSMPMGDQMDAPMGQMNSQMKEEEEENNMGGDQNNQQPPMMGGGQQ